MKKLTLAQVKALAKIEGKVLVYLVPSNCHPNNQTWVQPFKLDVRLSNGTFFHFDQKGTPMLLDSVLNQFKVFNCNNELGYRIHYYMSEQPQVEPNQDEKEIQEIEDIEIEIENPLAIIRKALDDLANAETELERDNLYDLIQSLDDYQDVTKTHVMEVWYIFDHLYFDKEKADLFRDGKERPQLQFIIAEEGDTIHEGTDDYARYDTYDQAQEELEEGQ